MEEGLERNHYSDHSERDELYSKIVKAGKRTYFFDVKSTRSNELYVTVTESKKRFNREGRYFYEKHKIFLYREDFEGFVDALNEMFSYVEKESPRYNSPRREFRRNQPEQTEQPEQTQEENVENFEEEAVLSADNYINIEFDDLDSSK